LIIYFRQFCFGIHNIAQSISHFNVNDSNTIALMYDSFELRLSLNKDYKKHLLKIDKSDVMECYQCISKKIRRDIYMCNINKNVISHCVATLILYMFDIANS